MSDSRIGMIGGSGLYEMEQLELLERVQLDTPFGKPSDEFVVGRLSGREVVFLARHGKGHRILPSEINYRANIWGMKKLGVGQILSVSAVGSLKDEIEPGHLVFPDQFIDRTCHRQSTFFGEGIVAHVGFGNPVCKIMRERLSQASKMLGFQHHSQGTYVCMEGPQFSTKAESNLYRSWNADIIGMTNLTEAKLAREAQICYATIALATDYDCWHPDHDSVTTDQVLKTLFSNIEKAKKLVVQAAGMLPEQRDCGCATALRSAIATNKSMLSDAVQKRLELILGRKEQKGV